MDTTLDPTIVALTRAIKKNETGTGDTYNLVPGADGERGAYQFLPSTWKTWAGKHLGDENAPMTMENQNKVAYAQVKEYKDAGYNPGQIASLWNSGKSDPTGNVGTSKGGASYDTPTYVQNVYKDYLSYKGEQSGQDTTQTTDTQTPETTPSQSQSSELLGGIVPNIQGLDQTLGNMPGTLGAVGSGVYNAAKGLFNIGKAGVVDLFNLINHPVDSTVNAAKFVGGELGISPKLEHIDAIGQLLRSTLGSEGAAGVGTEIGKLITDTIGKTHDTFSGGKLAGDTINTLLTAITGGSSGAMTEQVAKDSIEKAVENGILGKKMGSFLNKYVAGMALPATEAGTVGAGFQVGTNLNQGNPALQNTKQAFFAGAAVPGELNAAGKVLSKFPTKLPFTLSKEDFSTQYDKAFPPNKGDIKSGPARYERANDLMSYIVSNKDSIGIKDEAGDIKTPSQYTNAENLDALKKIQPDIYKEYTGLLGDVDKEKFQSGIDNGTKEIISDLNKKLDTTISSANRNTIKTMIKELSSEQMKNATPETLQDHIKDLGNRAFRGDMTEGKAIIAEVGGKLKTILGKSMDELTGKQYEAARRIYRASKEAEGPWSRAALKEIKNVPSLYDKLTGMGMTAEGIQFLITHDPASLAIALGLKGASKFGKWLNSPNRAMRNIYKSIEKNPTSSIRGTTLEKETPTKTEPTKQKQTPQKSKPQKQNNPEPKPINPNDFVDSTGKESGIEIMKKLDGVYSRKDIIKTMEELHSKNNTNRFTPKEVSDILSKYKPIKPLSGKNTTIKLVNKTKKS